MMVERVGKVKSNPDEALRSPALAGRHESEEHLSPISALLKPGVRGSKGH
jgi:hypothetical protein